MRNAALVIAVALLFVGCARVYVPPAVDLEPHEVIGLIEFTSNSEGRLAKYVTQKFIESITEDQKELRIVELGHEDKVLDAIGKTELDVDAYRAIADTYDIKTLFVGELRVSEVRPVISIGPGFSFASFEARVSASLSAKLVETETGATLWTNSGSDEQTVAGVSKFGSSFSFEAEDPEEAYGHLARSLCHKVTRDFRHSWKHKCWCQK